jgi:hypothetical protein
MSIANATSQAHPPEHQPDEGVLMTMLVDMQLKHLIELRELAMDMARDIAGAQKPSDLAFARISKVILQICAMEQHTMKLRSGAQEKLRSVQAKAKKAAVKQGVAAAIDSALAGMRGGPGAAALRARQQNLLQGIFARYDFSDPRVVAAMVADICRQLGVPERPDIWPTEAQEPAEEKAEAAGAAEPPAPSPRSRAAASPAALRATYGTASSPIGLMTHAPPVRPPQSGRGPP